MITRLLIIILLLVVSALFAAAEVALVRSRRSRLEALTRSEDRLARLAVRAMSDLPRMLSASQFGITLASLGVGAVTIDLARLVVARTGFASGTAYQVSLAIVVGATLAFVLVGLLHAAVAGLAPRAAAQTHADRLARLLAPGLLVFARVTAPLLAIVEWVAGVMTRPLGAPARDDDAPHSQDELRLLVERSEEGGEIEELDAALLEGVFEFSEKTAREVMTPRTEIVALPADATLEEALAIVEEDLRSRYPVFEDTIDDIIGMVLAKDLLRVVRRSDEAFSLRTVMRPVHIIPGSRAVEDVLADFKRRKEHLAIVLDEYGGTAGLVTMEDLLEEIVGEILDEYDEVEPSPPMDPSGDVIVSGTTNVGELNERFGLSLPEGEYATVGGFVFAALGRLPVVGDRVSGGGALFTVREMAGRRIESLSVDLHAAGDRRSIGRRA